MKVLQPVSTSPLWPASWVAAVDKTGTSKSAVVRDIWEIYDKALEVIPVNHMLAINTALSKRSTDVAWAAWSASAEEAPANAFHLGWLDRGRGSALLKERTLGGNRVSKMRTDLVDPTSASEGHLFRNHSLAPLLSLKSRLKAVLNLLESVAHNGLTLGRSLQFDRQWSAVLRDGPAGVLDWDYLIGGPSAGLDEFRDRVKASIDKITDFVQQVVINRRDFAIRRWRSWVLEDPLVHPCRWLRPDDIPPAPFFSCYPKDSVDGFGVLYEPHAIDEHFRKAWMSFFSRGEKGSADLEAFREVAEGLIPILDEVHLPSLTGDMLCETIEKKKPTAGRLDGWGLREFKALPVAWLDRLASIFTLIEEDGVWPDGLLDAYVSMIPKTDGDATPLGQRPLCVLPIVKRLWASARLQQLKSWLESWVPESVFSAGGGKSSVEAWYSTALDLEESLSGALDSDVRIFVADVVKSFDTVDRRVLDYILSRLGLPGWFRHAYFQYHAKVRLRFKLSCVVGQAWTRDGGIPQGCPLSMNFIVALYLPWCRYLDTFRGVKPQLYADNLKCVSSNDDDLLEAAKFTNTYIRLVGQTPAPSECVLVSTSKVVRGLMKEWILSENGDKWSVKLDVRDLGGHLDTTHRRRATTLIGRVLGLLGALLLVMALPLTFTGMLRVLRSKNFARCTSLVFLLPCFRNSELPLSLRSGLGECPLRSRPGLPQLHQLDGPFQHFTSAIWEAWQAKVSFDLCRRQGFR